MEAVWGREVMAEGRNQACQHWHEKLSAWRGGRVMRVCKGEWEGNPRQLLFLWVFQSSHKNAALIWEKFKSGKGATCPRVLSVSKLVRQSRAGTGHVAMLPNNSQACFRHDSGPEIVTARTQSHRGLEAEILWAESHITPRQLAQSSGRPLATFQLLQLKHLRKWRFSAAFYTTFHSAFILPHATLIRSRKLRKLF